MGRQSIDFSGNENVNGDTIGSAFNKANGMFEELYDTVPGGGGDGTGQGFPDGKETIALSAGVNGTVTPLTDIKTLGRIFLTAAGDASLTAFPDGDDGQPLRATNTDGAANIIFLVGTGFYGPVDLELPPKASMLLVFDADLKWMIQ